MDQLICDALRGELNAEIALSPGFRWGTTALAGQPLTMEDVLAQTAITYPETYVQSMTGGQIKDVLEDVCDNLFNADPYYQQGGDMVRVGGLAYTCTPNETVGKRISELKLDNGHALQAGKSYKVAGWASVNEQTGAPVWDVRRQTSAVGQAAEPGGAGRDAERRRRQSGHCGTGMNRLFDHPSHGDRGASDRSRRARRPRPAGAAAGQAVCRAQDRAAALRQRPAQAGPRASASPAI